MSQIVDQVERKRCQKKQKDVSFFKKKLLYMNVRVSKIRSVHTYVMTRTVYFDWICRYGDYRRRLEDLAWYWVNVPMGDWIQLFTSPCLLRPRLVLLTNFLNRSVTWIHYFVLVFTGMSKMAAIWRQNSWSQSVTRLMIEGPRIMNFMIGLTILFLREFLRH